MKWTKSTLGRMRIVTISVIITADELFNIASVT
jgi:hypothetical protein